MSDFNSQLEKGKVGESLVAQWLIHRGNSVLPVYDKAENDGKGPQLYTGDGALVAPDMFVFGERTIWWVEAKTKTAFSWYRIKKRWVTGIDQRHYEEYKKVEAESLCDVWLLFLHLGSQPSANDIAHNCPATCPTGLFGQHISVLDGCISHTSENHGTSGMVYWSYKSLKLMERAEDVATTPSH